MIGLDTNVVIRFFTKDDPKQFAEAEALLTRLENAGDHAYVSHVVLCEIVWVLSRAYNTDKSSLISTLEMMLDANLFVIEAKEQVRAAIVLWKNSGGDFSDYLIGLHCCHAGCSTVATFDEKLHRHSELFLAPVLISERKRGAVYPMVGSSKKTIPVPGSRSRAHRPRGQR